MIPAIDQTFHMSKVHESPLVVEDVIQLSQLKSITETRNACEWHKLPADRVPVNRFNFQVTPHRVFVPFLEPLIYGGLTLGKR